MDSDFVISPYGSYYMSIMDAAEYLRVKSGKIEEYIKSGHIRLSTMYLHRRKRLVIFADVQRVRDELRGAKPPKSTPLIEPNATLGEHPGCGACLKLCAVCKRVESRQVVMWTEGKYSNKKRYSDRLVSMDEATEIMGCTSSELDRYVARGKIYANFTVRKNHHYSYSDIRELVQRDLLKAVDYREERRGIVNALEQMIELRRQEMSDLDAQLVEHSVGYEEPLFRYGKPADMLEPPSGKWYVYHLCHPSGRPFYVGKGIGDRMYHHVKEAKRGVDSYKCNLIRKLQRDGKEIRYRVVFVTPDEREAYEYEIFEIARIGLDKLTNMTTGGFTREEHERVMGLNIDRGMLSYKQFSERLKMHPNLTPQRRKEVLRGWAFERIDLLETLLDDAISLSHYEARHLLEKEINIVSTYTARQRSLADLEDYRRRSFWGARTEP